MVEKKSWHCIENTQSINPIPASESRFCKAMPCKTPNCQHSYCAQRSGPLNIKFFYKKTWNSSTASRNRLGSKKGKWAMPQTRQAVSHQLLITETQVCTQNSSMWNLCGQHGTGKKFFSNFVGIFLSLSLHCCFISTCVLSGYWTRAC